MQLPLAAHTYSNYKHDANNLFTDAMYIFLSTVIAENPLA